MSATWWGGRARVGETVAAAMLMGLFLAASFVTLIFMTLAGSYTPSWYGLFALSAFLTGIPMRRRGAALQSTLLGSSAATALALVATWVSASPEIREFGAPDPLGMLLLIAIITLGVIAAFRAFRPSSVDKRWNKMGLW